MTAETKRGHIEEVPRGTILTQAMIDAIPKIDSLVGSRYVRRLADGRLEARLPFKMWLPDK